MSNQIYFVYGNKEMEHLKRKDQRLGAAIERVGLIKREVNPDLFSSLINSIVGQQISTKAQLTVWKRMQERFQPFTPETLNKVDVETIQACGISMRKAGYISGITSAILNKEVNLQSLAEMPDEEVIKELTKFKGVGIWTAEMLLTFSMQRPDVVSFGDLAIQRGMRMLYGHKKITRELFKKYKRRYSPYGTVASLYLWAIAGGALPELKDPAPGNK